MARRISCVLGYFGVRKQERWPVADTDIDDVVHMMSQILKVLEEIAATLKGGSEVW